MTSTSCVAHCMQTLCAGAMLSCNMSSSTTGVLRKLALHTSAGFFPSRTSLQQHSSTDRLQIKPATLSAANIELSDRFRLLKMLWWSSCRIKNEVTVCRPEERQRLEALRDAQAAATAAAAGTPSAPIKGKPAKPDPKVTLLSPTPHTHL